MDRLRAILMVCAMAMAFSVIGLASPRCALACSCASLKPMAAYATDPDVVVLTGRVVAVDHNQRGTFRVERWYKGGGIAVDIPIQGGDGANCGIRLTAGDHLVMVAFFSDNVLSSSICSPSGDLATPAGRQLEQDAVHTFGEGWLPGRHEAAQ